MQLDVVQQMDLLPVSDIVCTHYCDSLDAQLPESSEERAQSKIQVIKSHKFKLKTFVDPCWCDACKKLLYGLVRPWVSKRWRREIEPDEDDDDEGIED